LGPFRLLARGAIICFLPRVVDGILRPHDDRRARVLIVDFPNCGPALLWYRSCADTIEAHEGGPAHLGLGHHDPQGPGDDNKSAKSCCRQCPPCLPSCRSRCGIQTTASEQSGARLCRDSSHLDLSVPWYDMVGGRQRMDCREHTMFEFSW
jgi:hypothetical protein